MRPLQKKTGTDWISPPFKFLVALLVCGLTTQCSSTSQNSGTSSSTGAGSTGVTPSPSATPSSTPSTTPVATNPCGEALTGTTPAYSFNFNISGNSGMPTKNPFTTNVYTTGPISTDQTLCAVVTKMNSTGTILPLPGETFNPGATVGMDCVQLTLSMGNFSQQVLVSTNASSSSTACSGAVQNPSVDFSGDLSSGHLDETLTLSNAETDTCDQYGYLSIGGCALHNLWFTYELSGILTVYTSDTES